MNNYDKEKITRRFLTLFLVFFCASYVMKIFGSKVFEFVATNERIINICNFIENTLILNWICYGILNFVLVYFITFYVSKRFGTKNIWVNLIIILFAFGMNIVRYYINGWEIVFLFDMLQYIVFPTLISTIVFKNNVEESIINSLILYFCVNGLLMVSMTLNGYLLKVYSISILYQLMNTIELYIFVVVIYLNINYRRIKDVKNY